MDSKPKYRTRCFLDVSINGESAGRIVLELFSDVCPQTAENFRALCTGEMGVGKKTCKPLHYVGAPFHRIVKNFMIQAGDFSEGNGSGGESVFGGTFQDENFKYTHDKGFLLSMANRGKDTNGSQFFITTQPAPHLDGKHVVFGRVVQGQDIVTMIESEKTDSHNRPLRRVLISHSGELVLQKVKAKKHRSMSSSESESSVDSSSTEQERRHRRKSKKKSRKHKKRKLDSDSPEEGEVNSFSTVTAEEVPDIPVNNFLLRNTEPQREAGSRDVSEDPRRSSSSNVQMPYGRFGPKIKGRGTVRYTMYSRDRSRSVTPPHWRRESRRTVSLGDADVQSQHVWAKGDRLQSDDQIRESSSRRTGSRLSAAYSDNHKESRDRSRRKHRHSESSDGRRQSNDTSGRHKEKRLCKDDEDGRESRDDRRDSRDNHRNSRDDRRDSRDDRRDSKDDHHNSRDDRHNSKEKVRRRRNGDNQEHERTESSHRQRHRRRHHSDDDSA